MKTVPNVMLGAVFVERSCDSTHFTPESRCAATTFLCFSRWEAAAYFGIGMNKLRELTEDEHCKFVLYVGTRRLIKRRLFKAHLERVYSL